MSLKPPEEGARVAATCQWCGSPMWRVYHGPNANQTHEPRLPDDYRGAVEAERHRNASLVRALAGNSWDPAIEAALYEAARQITASGGQ
jgi:hypothetical protein